jgi:hypothetical protein
MDIVFSPGVKMPDFRSIESVTALPMAMGYEAFVQFSCEKQNISVIFHQK